jgi:ATP-dependent DNA helicase RecG
VYPTVAGLPQPYLRRAVITGLNHADLSETLPPNAPWPDRRGAWSLRDALQFLHHPTPDVSMAALEDRSHPAWIRLKCEELLAQQLSQLTAKRERDRLRAPQLRQQAGGLHERLLAQPGRSSASARKSPPIWRGPCPCTACCRAMWARARRWWLHSPP